MWRLVERMPAGPSTRLFSRRLGAGLVSTTDLLIIEACSTDFRPSWQIHVFRRSGQIDLLPDDLIGTVFAGCLDEDRVLASGYCLAGVVFTIPLRRQKLAYVYVRQSSVNQVLQHQESTELQYRLVDRAIGLGWPHERVQVIDADLGKSGAGVDRHGFQKLIAEIGLGNAGLVVSLDASCLACNNRDWHQLARTLLGIQRARR